MSLFDDKARHHIGPPAWWQDAYSYIDSSARPIAGKVRDFYERAFAAMDPARTADLRAKFRAARSDSHLGAAAEIVLHEVMRRGTLPVEINPSVQGGLTPDFRAGRQGPDSVLVELRALGDGANPHLRGLFDCLERIDAPRLRFELQIRHEPKAPLRLGKVRRAVQAFANQASAAPVSLDTAYAELPRFDIKDDDGVTIVRLRARTRRRPGVGRVVGVSDMSRSEFLSIDEVRTAISRKASKYSAVSEPFVVALAPNRSFIRRDEIVDALYGDPLPDRAGRDDTGIWRGPPRPQRTRLSGVLVVYGFKLWPTADTRIELFKNPWATKPITGNPFRCDVSETVDGQLTRTPGATLGELLGLPASWPGED